MRIRNTLLDFSLKISDFFSGRRRPANSGESEEQNTEHPPSEETSETQSGVVEPTEGCIADESEVQDGNDRTESSKASVLARMNEIERHRDAALRKNFIPHAVLLTERDVPSQITIYGMSGGDARNIVIRFPQNTFFKRRELSPEQYSSYVLEVMPDEVMFKGKTTGYVVNYAYDHAIEYDLQGNVVEVRDRYEGIGTSLVM